MTNTPLITILMPCYNALPYLPEALESIINQTYANLEILCINDGSTDETASVLEEYAQKDKRIRVVHNETNLKLIKTLNKGVDLAKGEYIARMDADDISLPDRIQKLYSEIIKSRANVVSSGYGFISEEGALLMSVKPICTIPKSIEYASFFITPMNHAGSLFKASCLKEVKYTDDEKYIHVEDYRLWTQLIKEERKLTNVKEPLYKIRKNLNSVSYKYEELQKKNFYHTLQEHHQAMGFPCSAKEAQVIGLRINEGVSKKDFKSAMNHKKSITRFYIKKANDDLLKQEIHTFNRYITLSIILQAIKRGNLSVKLSSILYFMKKPILKMSIWKLIFNRT